MGNKLHIVTGAYGFSGRYIAQRLLEKGYKVKTLTDSTGRANELQRRLNRKKNYLA